MNTSRLPLDLWFEVFPYFHADVHTLRSLSLTCLFFRNMSIPYLFRSLIFPFPSSLRRAFHLLHSTYIHSYVENMNLSKRPPRPGSMKLRSPLQVIILALLKMKHLQRFALDFPCPTELYEYIRDSKMLKQLTWADLAKTSMTVRPQCQLEVIEFSDMGRECHVPAGLIIESASTLKSLSIYSSWYISIFWASVQTNPFSQLTSFTFSSMDEYVAPHALRGILESCPSIITLHLPTRLRFDVLLSPSALPKLNTLDAGPNSVFWKGVRFDVCSSAPSPSFVCDSTSRIARFPSCTWRSSTRMPKNSSKA